ncbi:MAG: MerR family DNA-binding transcriptional regulator [Pseudomonadota bacterium]
MTETTLTIRQMCDAYDVTPRTLRFYEAKELLFPIRQGTRRLFTKRDQARLKLILRGKRFGFSLEEIRQLLDLYHIGDSQATQLRKTHEIASVHLEEMISQRDDLNKAIGDLKDQLGWVEKILSDMEQPQAAQ